MQKTLQKTMREKRLRDSAISIPKLGYATKILTNDIEIDSGYSSQLTGENVLIGMWNKQHPLIHTWLVLSSISICFLSALFFIIP